jgi:hypothetical protein
MDIRQLWVFLYLLFDVHQHIANASGICLGLRCFQKRIHALSFLASVSWFWPNLIP